MLASLAIAGALLCSGASEAPIAQMDEHALMALRDVSGLSISPDGRQIAFQVQQADLATNSYRSVWCVASANGGPARAIGDGGEIAMPVDEEFGRPTGVWMTLAARWSPRSDAIGVLVRRDGRDFLEICRMDASGCIAPPVPGEPRDFIWSDDGSAIIFQTSNARALRDQQLREGDTGFHVDERFDVFHTFAPVRLAVRPTLTLRALNLDTGVTREPSASERITFAAGRPDDMSARLGASRSITALSTAGVTAPVTLGADIRDFFQRGDILAWSAPSDPAKTGSQAPLALFVSDQQHGTRRCLHPACTGQIEEFEVTPDASAVLFIRKEGWAGANTGIYLWTLAHDDVRRLVVTGDDISLCTARSNDAICFREGATRPRTIVRLSFADGALTTLFEPNPQISPHAFAPARRLEWRLDSGQQGFGYLITPPRWSGHRLPLVIVQYRATGFLRGGVGDEYPIQAFAHRGLAVLVIERAEPPEAERLAGSALDDSEWDSLKERWRNLDNLRHAIVAAVVAGVADPAKVGLTGLSDGGETAAFALIHCGCIAAAALSGGIDDPIWYYTGSDDAHAQMRRDGRGDIARGRGAAWRDLSLSLNVASVRAPILVQAPDREILFSMEAARTFADEGSPFDLYVFPNEYHVKWQPRHRAAIYARSLDWFDFWLRGVEHHDPLREPEYQRWRAWRTTLNQPRS